jgi:hypothetical protein
MAVKRGRVASARGSTPEQSREKDVAVLSGLLNPHAVGK